MIFISKNYKKIFGVIGICLFGMMSLVQAAKDAPEQEGVSQQTVQEIKPLFILLFDSDVISGKVEALFALMIEQQGLLDSLGIKKEHEVTGGVGSWVVDNSFFQVPQDKSEIVLRINDAVEEKRPVIFVAGGEKFCQVPEIVKDLPDNAIHTIILFAPVFNKDKVVNIEDFKLSAIQNRIYNFWSGDDSLRKDAAIKQKEMAEKPKIVNIFCRRSPVPTARRRFEFFRYNIEDKIESLCGINILRMNIPAILKIADTRFGFGKTLYFSVDEINEEYILHYIRDEKYYDLNEKLETLDVSSAIKAYPGPARSPDLTKLSSYIRVMSLLQRDFPDAYFQVASLRWLDSLIQRCQERFSNYLKDNSILIDAQNSYAQKFEVPVDTEICFIGDIHGDAHAFAKILQSLQDREFLNENYTLKKNFKIICVGDYVDRRPHGCNVWAGLLQLKLANWDDFILLRGNHEDLAQNKMENQADWIYFGFELNAKYKKNAAPLLNKFGKLYAYLPQAMYLRAGDNKRWAMCCHGGLHPGIDASSFLNSDEQVKGLHFEQPFSSSFNGFTWGDFEKTAQGVIQQKSLNSRVVEEKEKAIFYTKPIPVMFSKDNGPVVAMFRGHQHCVSLGMFGESSATAPVDWDKVVDPEDKFVFNVAKYNPVFTFTAAGFLTEHEHAFYGILRTANKFEDWLLYPNICN